jgi:hypothetical protein
VPSRIDDLATFLAGSWRLQRTIVEGGSVVGSFTGTGTFDPAPAGDRGVLRYRERGTLHLDGTTVTATRCLVYRVTGSRAQVAFEDGRPFHDLDLSTGVDVVEHPCGADRYRGRLEVLDADTWHHTWRVTGPHKDHEIRTVLARDG